jgi:uncharacterized membrane protein YhhN
MKRAALLLFILLSLIELAGQAAGWLTLHAWVKPSLMPALLAWYWLAAGAGQRSVWVLAALVFSCAGDTLLLFQQEPQFFIFGLGAFLVGHLFYIFAYRQHQQEVETDTLGNVRKLRMAFPVLLAGIGFVVVLFPVLGSMRMPVIVYAAVIQVMVITSIFRWGRTNTASFFLVLLGAVLFMISDSMIAINKFYTPFAHASFAIMSTYLLGQFLIVRGLLRH